MAEGPRERGATTEGTVAIDDATRVLARIEADEAAAERTRSRIDREGLPTLALDAEIGVDLEPGERVIAVRQGARVAAADGSGNLERDRIGRLYLTDRRLFLSGRHVPVTPLSAIEELSVAGEHLLIALRDGSAISFDVTRPREFRVLISTALAMGRR